MRKKVKKISIKMFIFKGSLCVNIDTNNNDTALYHVTVLFS